MIFNQNTLPIQFPSSARPPVRTSSISNSKSRISNLSAFTLTELLVSIGLVAILMLAANAIFKTTAETVGAGQAMSTGIRDLRTVHSTIKRDLEGAAMDGPFFMIRSSVQAAFPNQKDQQGDKDYIESAPPAIRLTQTLSADPTQSGTETARSVTSYGVRTFRTDMLGFFARGQYRRQTGNTGTFAASQNSNEAYVWYGHLWMPNALGNYYTVLPVTYGLPWGDSATFPGADTYSTNSNNFYASNWVLGRCALLLQHPDGTNYQVNDVSGQPQYYVARALGLPANSASLAPLSVNSRCTQGGAAYTLASATPVIQDMRYDLVGNTIGDYRAILSNAITNAPLPNWFDDNHFGYRFKGNPFPSRPLDSTKAAQVSPIFVPQCSEFIVEYAGNFLAEDASANTTGVCWDYSATPPAPKSTGKSEPDYDIVNGVKRIRWYGMPRSSANNSVIDVVPLHDYWNTVTDATSLDPVSGKRKAPFERDISFGPNAPASSGNYVNTLLTSDHYTIVWGPDFSVVNKPMMIRIVLKVEDPSGRTDLPWQEMIFTLPQ